MFENISFLRFLAFLLTFFSFLTFLTVHLTDIVASHQSKKMQYVIYNFFLGRLIYFLCIYFRQPCLQKPKFNCLMGNALFCWLLAFDLVLILSQCETTHHTTTYPSTMPPSSTTTVTYIYITTFPLYTTGLPHRVALPPPPWIAL